MPFMSQHLGLVNPSERLIEHNIGMVGEIVSLISKYSTSMTSFRNNHSIRWQNTLPNGTVYDFAIDNYNGFLFYITNTTASRIVCLDLKTGTLIWAINDATLFGSITCSPKTKHIYAQSGAKIMRFDYSGGFVNERNFGWNMARPLCLDKYNVVLVHVTGAPSGNYTRRFKIGLDLANIQSVNEASTYGPPTTNKFQTKNVYSGVAANFNRYNIDTMTTVESVGGNNAGSSTWSSILPRIIDGDFAYTVSTYNVGNPFTVYRVHKHNVVTKTNVWTKQITTTPSGQTGFAYTFTQDTDNVYIAITPRTNNGVVAKEIYVMDKETSDITNITNEPDSYLNDPNILLIHTYDTYKYK